MKIKINRIDFLLKLKMAKMIVPSSSILYVLESVVLEFKDSKLFVTSSSLDLFFCFNCEYELSAGDVNQSPFLLNFKWLLNVVTSIQDDDFYMSYNLGDVTIYGDDYNHTSSVGDNYYDYPKSPDILDSKNIKCSSVVRFKDALKSALKFVSNDDLRPSMTGVCLSFKKGKTYIVSTDAHRMFFREEGILCDGVGDLILPKQAASFISKNISVDAELSVSKNWFMYKSECFSFWTRLIDARYPDWEKVVPSSKELQFNFVVNKSKLKSIVSALLPLSNPSTRQVVSVFQKNNLQLSVSDADSGTKSMYNLQPLQSNVESDFKTAFDCRFLLSAVLVNPKSYDCVLKFSGSPHRTLILDEEVLLMPLMINEQYLGEITKIYDKVKSLLERSEYYRDNDDALTCRIWTNEIGGDDKIKSMTLHDFFVMYSKGLITSSESIYRAKRKIMENFPHLRGASYQKRKSLEDSVKAEIKNLKE